MDIKIFKTKKHFKKADSFINLDIYWKFILVLGFLLILTSLFFGLYIFMQTNEEFVLASDNSVGKIKIVKKERIDAALQYFTEREQKSTEILNSRSAVTDPSL